MDLYAMGDEDAVRKRDLGACEVIKLALSVGYERQSRASVTHWDNMRVAGAARELLIGVHTSCDILR